MNQNLKFITKLLKHFAKIMNISLAPIAIKSQKGDSTEVSAFNTSGLYPWIIIHSIIELYQQQNLFETFSQEIQIFLKY